MTLEVCDLFHLFIKLKDQHSVKSKICPIYTIKEHLFTVGYILDKIKATGNWGKRILNINQLMFSILYFIIKTMDFYIKLE